MIASSIRKGVYKNPSNKCKERALSPLSEHVVVGEVSLELEQNREECSEGILSKTILPMEAETPSNNEMQKIKEKYTQYEEQLQRVIQEVQQWIQTMTTTDGGKTENPKKEKLKKTE